MGCGATIHLRGETYRFCPDFDDLARLENALSYSITMIARKLADSELTMQELLVIAQNCLEPRARTMDLKNAIVEAGLSALIEPLAELFLSLLDANARAQV